MSKLLIESNLNECISSIDYSSAGDYLAVGLLDERVIVMNQNYENFKEVFRFEGNILGVVDVKFNSAGNYLAVSALDSCIRIYNIDDGTKENEIVCSPMESWKLAFDPLGRSVITCGELGIVKFYDIETGESTGILKTADIFATCIAYSKNERFLAIGNNLGNVFVYDMQDGKKLEAKKCFKLDGHGKIVRSLSFTSDGTKLLTASDDQHINVIDLTKIQIILALTGHKSNINCIDIHPTDPNLFVSCSYDKSIKLWSLDKKDSIETLNYHQDNIWSVKYSPSGNEIASGSENGQLAIHKI